MEVRIGVQNVTRELSIDTELDADGVESALSEAVSAGGVFSLTDSKGRRVVVPVEKLGYVELGSTVAGHVGFRS